MTAPAITLARPTMATFVVLLRAVNVGGRKVEMAPLRKAAADAGFRDVRTYIASGNLVLEAAGKTSAGTIEELLEDAIAKRFGLDVPVVARSAEHWAAYLRPPKALAAAAKDMPARLQLALSKDKPRPAAVKELQARASSEQVVLQGDALWIHYPDGVGRSKLTPAAIDKAMGSPTTSRNLNTVRKLGALAGVG